MQSALGVHTEHMKFGPVQFHCITQAPPFTLQDIVLAVDAGTVRALENLRAAIQSVLNASPFNC